MTKCLQECTIELVKSPLPAAFRIMTQRTTWLKNLTVVQSNQNEAYSSKARQFKLQTDPKATQDSRRKAWGDVSQAEGEAAWNAKWLGWMAFGKEMPPHSIGELILHYTSETICWMFWSSLFLVSIPLLIINCQTATEKCDLQLLKQNWTWGNLALTNTSIKDAKYLHCHRYLKWKKTTHSSGSVDFHESVKKRNITWTQ